MSYAESAWVRLTYCNGWSRLRANKMVSSWTKTMSRAILASLAPRKSLRHQHRQNYHWHHNWNRPQGGVTALHTSISAISKAPNGGESGTSTPATTSAVPVAPGDPLASTLTVVAPRPTEMFPSTSQRKKTEQVGAGGAVRKDGKRNYGCESNRWSRTRCPLTTLLPRAVHGLPPLISRASPPAIADILDTLAASAFA